MPRLSQTEQILTEALHELENDWLTARASWRDKAREQFEVEFLEEIRPAVRTSASACTELTQLLRRVVRECQ